MCAWARPTAATLITVTPDRTAIPISTPLIWPRGDSTLLGNAGTLTGTGSFGLWTVIERGGYLYVQTTDNGIQVYGPMIDATHTGPLCMTYTKAQLDALTGIATSGQYYGMDLSADGRNMVLGAAFGNAYVLEPACRLSVTKSGSNVILSWPEYYTSAVIESSATLDPGTFAELYPQPAVKTANGEKSAVIAIDPATPAFYRLRKQPGRASSPRAISLRVDLQ